MENVVMKLLDNWHWVIMLFFIGQFLKLGLSSYLKIVEIKALNKDYARVELTHEGQILEIKSSKIQLDDLKNLSEENKVLLLENKKEKAS